MPAIKSIPEAGSYAAHQREQTTVRKLRPKLTPVASAALRPVPDAPTRPLLPSTPQHRREAATHDATAGGRLDQQGRLTCRKLLTQLGWDPETKLTTFVNTDRPLALLRRDTSDATNCEHCRRCTADSAVHDLLDDTWQVIDADVAITGKWELKLPTGVCHRLGVTAPGEVLPIALPGQDALLIASAASAADALLPPPTPTTASDPHINRRTSS